MSKELTGWKRKVVLLFKSEKRLGAKQVMLDYASKSYDEMKNDYIKEVDVDTSNASNAIRIKDLSKHLEKLKKAFINQPELVFYHATLIVLLRRDYRSKETFKEFNRLWEAESDFLLQNLSLRWIVSACDTFVDCSPNRCRAAIMMNVTSIINTLKIYETQYYLKTGRAIDHLIEENVHTLYKDDLQLYHGLTYFRIGSDDTLKHMRERYQNFYNDDWLATTVLLHVFDNLQLIDSAFLTMRQLHKDEKSRWW